MKLVRAAITAGVENDLGSGRLAENIRCYVHHTVMLFSFFSSNVDITVITAGNAERFRNIDKAEPKYKSKNPLVYAPGTTGISFSVVPQKAL